MSDVTISVVTGVVASVEMTVITRASDGRQQQFRAGLVLKALRLLYHSTLGSRVIKEEKKESV